MAKGKVFTFFSALFLSIVSPGLFPGHAFYTKAQEKEASVPIIIGNNFGKVYVRPKVKPLNEIKMKNIIRQKLDFSCGSAAVATIYLNNFPACLPKYHPFFCSSARSF